MGSITEEAEGVKRGLSVEVRAKARTTNRALKRALRTRYKYGAR